MVAGVVGAAVVVVAAVVVAVVAAALPPEARDARAAERVRNPVWAGAGAARCQRRTGGRRRPVLGERFW